METLDNWEFGKDGTVGIRGEKIKGDDFYRGSCSSLFLLLEIGSHKVAAACSSPLVTGGESRDVTSPRSRIEAVAGLKEGVISATAQQTPPLPVRPFCPRCSA